ncbi:hypothetical protein [Sphingopyxis sp. GW247-27LB]|uniref:hypothetical protein n=1 Tax=Sphingopyxis sp. GW247-27LB TaxID=2012632 RepID=UPI000BA67E1B|nr:hypothetical protein [Sphingopyxis sp. GW247-27LB]PAL20223.1 hypothetical protein CD928_17605 [Sphingopyxis sp. GW247-27LB]
MRPIGDLRARADAVSRKLRAHKKAVRDHRRAAQDAATELAEIKAECARRGIALVLAPEGVPGRGAPTGRA